MKTLISLAAAAILVGSAPALAKPGHGHGYGHAPGVVPGAIGYAAGGCPPGLAKKAIPCVPPGQAKKLFGIGQRVPRGYQGLLGYNALPPELRSYYGPRLDPYSRYIYDRGTIYRVDPRTMLVEQILSALVRPR